MCRPPSWQRPARFRFTCAHGRPDAAAAERMLEEMVERITLALGENVFTSNGQTLEEIVARELTLNQATVATAESCTGGLLAERLTRVPGSSSYFLRRRGLLQQRSEDGVGGRARRAD